MSRYLETKFLEYHWNELWSVVQKSSNTEHEVFQCILLAAWWQEFGLAEVLRKKIWRTSSDDFEVFAYSYVSLCIGDRNGYLKAQDVLQRRKSADRYLKWLQLEWLGRSRQFEIQARFFRKIVMKYPKDNWPYAACLQSLNQLTISSEFLESTLENLAFSDNVAHLRDALKFLLARKLKKNVLVNSTDNAVHGDICDFHKGWYLSEQEDISRAVVVWDKAARNLWIDYGMLNDWLALSISSSNTEDSTENRVLHALSIVPNNPVNEAAVATIALIRYWVEQKDVHAYNLISKYEFFKDTSQEDSRNLRVFFLYILLLFVHRQENIATYASSIDANCEKLYVIGESHSLSPSNLRFTFGGRVVLAVSKFVMGVKIWHLTSNKESLQKSCLIARLDALPSNSNVLLCIGEIDSRPDQGIWKNYKKNPNKNSINEIVAQTLAGYRRILKTYKSKLNIIIQNVPAPTDIAVKRLPAEDLKEYLEMFEVLNSQLKEMAVEEGVKCLDVFSATKGKGGLSNLEWHLDAYHLKPIFYLNSEPWIV